MNVREMYLQRLQLNDRLLKHETTALVRDISDGL